MSKFGIYLTLPLFLLIFAACASAAGPKGEAAQTANLDNKHCHIFIDKRNILFPERTPVLLEINLHRLLVDNYSVFCFIKLQQVFVVSVLYSSMDIAKRFQNL